MIPKQQRLLSAIAVAQEKASSKNLKHTHRTQKLSPRQPHEDEGPCVSFYQVSKILDVPYEVSKKLIRAGLRNNGCTTSAGAVGIRESDFKRFRDKFEIVKTITGQWTLKHKAQLTLPGF